jgi:hypothetical protein
MVYLIGLGADYLYLITRLFVAIVGVEELNILEAVLH